MSNYFATENLLRSFGILPTYIRYRCILISYRMHATRRFSDDSRRVIISFTDRSDLKVRKPDSNAVLRF